MIGLMILYLVCSICLNVKRFHDRDMSGLWQLVCFNPYLGGLYGPITLGLLRGTGGANTDGPDPLLAEPPHAQTRADETPRASS